MNILIDALGLPPYGGARSASVGLAQALSKEDPTSKSIVLVSWSDPWLDGYPNVEQRVVKISGQLGVRLWLQAYLPHIVKEEGIDIVHFTKNLAAIVPNTRAVVTVNDLTRIFYPSMFSNWDILYWNLVQRYVLRRADQLIAISHRTKSDLIEWLDLSVNKVAVVAPGLSSAYHLLDSARVEEVIKKCNLPDNYILYVGGMARHKNLRTLILAFAQLKRRSDLPHKLVIVGGRYHTHNDDHAISLVHQPIENDVVFTGVVADEDLPAIYNSADLFVLPSLYEGFGLVALEAMACGVPIIAAASGALPEVIGESGILIQDALDVDTFAHHMQVMLSNRAIWEDYRAKGLENARRFSWESAAKKTLDIYARLLQE